MNILLCPPDILLQHPREEWKELQQNTPVLIATCASQTESVLNHMGEGFSFLFYENFDDNPLVEMDIYHYAQANRAAGIYFLAENDVLRAARISDRLGLTLAREKNARLFRNKFMMKSLVKEHQLKIPAMARADSATAIARFIAEHGYPCVIKANDGCASQAAVILKNEGQLYKYLSQMPPPVYHNLLIEKFIDGEAYQINALYLKNQPICLSASRAAVSGLGALAAKGSVSNIKDDKPLRRRLIAYARYLAEHVFPTEENTLLHLNVLIDKEGHIIFDELACCLGGGAVNGELKAAFGLDPRMTWLKACMKNTYPQDMSQRMPVLLPGQRNIAVYGVKQTIH